ncbi:MAG: diaminopimelate dehydrogenase [Spirochaetota bacterium]
MEHTLRLGIAGYGNVGRGVEDAIIRNPDMKLEAIFTRRSPETLDTRGLTENICAVSKAEEFTEAIDVLILCGGSATDLPRQGPHFAAMFNTVDSYDTHAKIPRYFESMDTVSRKAGRTSVIATGWDPGLFSVARVIEEAVLPQGKGYTFWGRGVSQGHSDAIRRIKGVKDARQYTIPKQEAIDRVRSGETPELSARQKHIRDCYVVAEEGADTERIRREIVNMPHYFADYETRVTFISYEEMKKNHSRMPHGGFVLRSGTTGENNNQIIEFSLNLASNPEFTGSVLIAYARAAWRLNHQGRIGAYTVFDIAPGYLSIRTPQELREQML